MAIRVNIHRYFLPDAAGSWVTAESSGKTIGECLKQIVIEFPQLKKEIFDPEGKLQVHVSIFLNGEDSYPEELSKKLNDGDIIDMIPIIGGG